MRKRKTEGEEEEQKGEGEEDGRGLAAVSQVVLYEEELKEEQEGEKVGPGEEKN